MESKTGQQLPESANSPLKVGIIGMGPVGMILAVNLHKAGCEVALCEVDPMRFKQIQTKGVHLINVINASAQFDHVYRSIDEMAELDLDYLIFSLKSYNTAFVARQAEILNTEKLTVISAQNGIDVEKILAEIFGESKTLRMVINFAGNLSSPNTVRVSFFNGPNYVGSINDQRSEQARRFAQALSSIGLDTEAVSSTELINRVWEKTILNAALSPLCGVGRLTMAEAMADPDTVELIEQTIDEGIEVAAKERIYFPNDFLRKCMRYLKKGGDHFPSLAGDLINKRPTEIDYFNGKIVEYGRKHYVRTTLNLAMTNMTKAMTNKNVIARIPGAAGDYNKRIIEKGLIAKDRSPVHFKGEPCFLGVDLGSAYTKLTVLGPDGIPVFRYSLEALSRDRHAMKNLLQAIHASFDITQSCATGYGRKMFTDSDLVKTEINCAAVGVSRYVNGEKNIIDIGGEDIKIVRCDNNNRVSNFHMNDKCAAGTGSFLTEISERAEISIADMSGLASQSDYDKELNSFCTVFAKTEVMKWIMDGMSNHDIARGIYISIANKIAKMRLDPGIPTVLIGGVIAHHPYLKTLLAEKFDMDMQVIDSPQYVVSEGAALIARRMYLNKTNSTKPSDSNEKEILKPT